MPYSNGNVLEGKGKWRLEKNILKVILKNNREIAKNKIEQNWEELYYFHLSESFNN